jgi:hypothetical protein
MRSCLPAGATITGLNINTSQPMWSIAKDEIGGTQLLSRVMFFRMCLPHLPFHFSLMARELRVYIHLMLAFLLVSCHM